MENKIKCESCNGRGWGVWSCCTGEPVDRDIMMCPKCYEHLGEEDCYDCDGTGYVDEDFYDEEEQHYVRKSYYVDEETVAARLEAYNNLNKKHI